MNGKITNGVVTFLGLVGTSVSIAAYFFTDSPELKKVGSIIITVTIISIVVAFYLRKKVFVDLFDTLNLLSENNKLHLIREMVMLISRKTNRHQNKNHIKTAKFIYNIFQSSESGYYDVEYNLDFLIPPKFTARFSRKDRLFDFFAICEQTKQENADLFIKSICAELKVDTHIIKIIPEISLIGGGVENDYIPRFAGLYRISVVIPNTMICNSDIELNIKYLHKQNIVLEDKKYAFGIIPMNYGNKVNKMEVILNSSDLKINQVALHCVDCRRGISTVGTFETDCEKSKYTVSINPKIKLPYIIQMEY